MICASCGEEIKRGYFREDEGEITYICSPCLIAYDRYRKVKQPKYDHAEICAIYKRGMGLGMTRKETIETISKHMGINPLTVKYILRKEL